MALFCNSCSAWAAAAATTRLQRSGPNSGKFTRAMCAVFHAGSICSVPPPPRITQKSPSNALMCDWVTVSSSNASCQDVRTRIRR